MKIQCDSLDLVNIAQSVETIRLALVTTLSHASRQDARAILRELDNQCPHIQQALKGILATLDKIADENNASPA